MIYNNNQQIIKVLKDRKYIAFVNVFKRNTCI